MHLHKVSDILAVPIITIIFLLFALIACNSLPEYYSNNIEYIKDDRTGICFALYTDNAGEFSLATVPCTEKVQNQIEKTKAKYKK